MYDEDTVWFFTWKRLLASNISVIGGEPPGGSSPLPRIEMKDPNSSSKGSAGSRKCDLYSVFEKTIFLIEAKDSHTKTLPDIEKLKDIIKSTEWTKSLWHALIERRLLAKTGNHDLEQFLLHRKKFIKPALAIPPSNDFLPPKGFLLIETTELKTTARFEKTRPIDDLGFVFKNFLELNPEF